MKYVLVTVGTTQFVDLVKAIENIEVHKILKNQGFERIFVQFGSASVNEFVRFAD